MILAGVLFALVANLVTAVALVIQKALAAGEAACPVGQDPFAPSILVSSVSQTPLRRWGLCLLAYLFLTSGYLFDILCLAHLSLSSVGALSASQLVFSTMIGCLFMGEALSLRGGAGVFCIIIGCVAIVFASPDVKGAKDEDALIIWLVVTATITIATAGIATFREKMWPSPEATEAARWGISLLPWLFAAVGGLSASDTLLLSKMLVEAQLYEWQVVLAIAILVEIVIQLYLVKASFAAASDGVVAVCVIVSSTFAVTTILTATVCAGLIYGEFTNYDSYQWLATAGGLFATTIGLCLLSAGREKAAR